MFTKNNKKKGNYSVAVLQRGATLHKEGQLILARKKKIKMPQLDQVTFFSQYFWLCFFFFTFYLFLYKHFLPKMSRILKYRKRKVEISQQGMSTMEQENEKAGSSYQTLLFSGLSHSASLFDGSLRQINSWLSQVMDKSNHTQLGTTNKNYIYSLGEKALSSQLAVSHPFAALPQDLFISSLLGSSSFFPKRLAKTSSIAMGKEGGVQSKSQQSSLQNKETASTSQKSKSEGKKNTRLFSNKVGDAAQVGTPVPNQAQKPPVGGGIEKSEKGKKRGEKKK